MKPIYFLSILCLIAMTLSWQAYTSHHEKKGITKTLPGEIKKPIAGYVLKELKEKAGAARLFVHRNGYNENLCFLLKMSLPSGQNRFFIYNLKSDSLQASGLVAHGNCFQNWLEGRRYSNVNGSGCTSLGRYKIGGHYYGKFGYSYKLMGLDSSNNNAFERTVVLHSHTCIPDTEPGDEICQSNGCPMVSPHFLEQLKTIINTSKKPVMLWIYE
jgi:hypothetical protein